MQLSTEEPNLCFELVPNVHVSCNSVTIKHQSSRVDQSSPGAVPPRFPPSAMKLVLEMAALSQASNAGAAWKVQTLHHIGTKLSKTHHIG